MDFDIDALAALARIRLSEKEKQSLKGDLSDILAYVEQIKELDTKDVQPLSHVLDIEDVFREDVVRGENDIAEKVIAVLPESSKDGRFFRVPKVIEGKE